MSEFATHGSAGDLHDLVCLSHLRWNFVFQRPQHLLTRCAAHRRVYFFEEPIFDSAEPWLERQRYGNVRVAVPHLPPGMPDDAVVTVERQLLDQLVAADGIRRFVLWYYTPLAVQFSDHLPASAIVYDCMDELSAFANAPAALKQCERRLLDRAHVVFTGGQSLYEAKRDAHDNVHAFPSSVDVAHFGQARQITVEPADQAQIPRPRLGFFGVIDERMDMELLRGVATLRPDWHLVLLGPIVKIDPANVPSLPNMHWLGAKTYADLPNYIAFWDVAMLPFARNEATRYISPTKTPEYMAAGRPVVSTSIRDVVRPYGRQGLVRIADTAETFVQACEAAMAENPATRLRDADAFLRQTSWDGTWSRMWRLVEQSCPDQAAARRAASAV
jgi:glycosyltransferase involved in cell wall biosynthesis